MTSRRADKDSSLDPLWDALSDDVVETSSDEIVANIRDEYGDDATFDRLCREIGTRAVEKSGLKVPRLHPNGSQLRKLAAVTDASSKSKTRTWPNRATHAWLPLKFAWAVVFAADLIIVVMAGISASAAYDWLFFERLKYVSDYLNAPLVIFAGLFSVMLAARGAYRFRNLLSIRHQLRDIHFSWVGSVLLGLAILFVLKESTSRGAAMLFLITGWWAMSAWRRLMSRYVGRAYRADAHAERKVLLIVEQSVIMSPEWLRQLHRGGYKLLQTFTLSQYELMATSVGSSLSVKMDEIIEACRQHNVEEILLFVSWHHRTCIEKIVRSLRIVPCRVRLILDENVTYFLRNRMSRFLPSPYDENWGWTAELTRAPLSNVELAIKRGADILFSSIALILQTPLLLLMALLIKLDSPGPVLFAQRRRGFDGRSFNLYKFRTIRVIEDNRDGRIEDYDPQITSLGRVLRKTRVDELPQLFNVLLGDMSLVGPRPLTMANDSENEQIMANYAFRHRVKPGVTGFAQLHGYRDEIKVDQMERRIELDAWYISNWSIWLDLRIIWGAAFDVMSGRQVQPKLWIASVRRDRREARAERVA